MPTHTRDHEPLPPSTDETDPHEAALDETIEASFPASDPPSTIPDPEPADEAETGGEAKSDDRPTE